ncbi:Biphenyl-2,3-diol 1,2-dioxygenase [Variovorax sp. PBS-H4]|uniref:VOC family protein n=1 Tax=Variovorax sp. PBS-H4 TaxID=434008 RepID=UPI001317EC84|nr:VOC family protein [Variovorax sp. PBS-H4]VTU41123.1 Biphenyl-2,3-diol 1,2-dioxygenase [Variovorax sp. PBS-H4]
MPPDLRLGYLIFEARKPARWASFCQHMLGLPAPRANADGSLGWQVDDASQRLIVREGPADDLAALGLECADEATLERLLARLRQGGIAVEAADAASRDARRVQRLHRCADPAGNTIELFTGLDPADRPFASEAFPAGFRTGNLGLGHAVLVSSDMEAMEAFYALLGFGVTERLATRVGPMDIRGVFLHCNQRHHSIALFDMPLAKRIHHFMLQAERLSDIGIAFERAQRHKVPLSLALGQHPDPDGTFSFYGATPSGFDFEIGAGTQTIDPAGWQPQQTGVTSAWGHKPSLRLQLKMAAGLIARKVSGTPRRAKELA